MGFSLIRYCTATGLWVYGSTYSIIEVLLALYLRTTFITITKKPIKCA